MIFQKVIRYFNSINRHFPTIFDATGVQKLDEDQETGESLFSILEGDTKERTILSEQHSAGAKKQFYG